MINTEQILEIDKIKEMLCEYAHTQNTIQKIHELRPYTDESELRRAMRETSEARTILDKMGNPPFTAMDGMDEYMNIASIGGCLLPSQLEEIEVVLTTVSRVKSYLERAKQLNLSLPYYNENLDSMDTVRDEIKRVIRASRVDDYATKRLKDIRGDMERLEDKMREKADTLLRTNKAYMSDSFYTVRNGHICFPVKKEYKLKFSGSVIDKSASGGTFFIEPASVSRYLEDIALLKIDEENEERTILYGLTAMFADARDIFIENERIIDIIDYAFAKASLSISIDGTEPEITTERIIKITNGRHPLMDKNICVPLNFSLGEDGINGVIITGPNTGGKTVSIKSVGLNSYMAGCGLHVACEKATICMNSNILCDIGDGQNISENLSTFSAHITNVLEILKLAGQESLVIMDELGSGTDPAEGMGIAIAILEELRKSGALYLITTHYPEVKIYAENCEGVINARMTFDRDSLKPLYKLEIGQAGESCALYIAKKLGMPGNMLKRAYEASYGETGSSKLLTDILQENSELTHAHTAKLMKIKKQSNSQKKAKEFNVGDSVMVYPDKKIGIVCKKADEKGVLCVQLQKKKIWINHTRIKLHVPASQLYPDDYDFSIVFDTVANRKAKHNMDRKFCEEETITYEGEKYDI